MTKIDFKKEAKHLYNPSAKQCVLVDVPAMNFLMLDGVGNPNNSPAFAAALETLYAVSYTLKFMVKKGEQAIDYAVAPLEGLWWTEKMAEFSIEHKENWQWTLMIRQPEFVTADLIATAKVAATKKQALPALSQLRFETYDEGVSAQIMHVGPFATEGPTIAKLHQFVAENGYILDRKHHEIYLSDLRRTAPEKMKTVIRQPVKQI